MSKNFAAIVLALTTTTAAAQTLDVSFVCNLTREVPIERNDPLLFTYIHLKTDCPVINLGIVHQTQKSLSSRGMQYAAVARCDNARSFSWEGSYAKDRSLSMAGSLYLGPDNLWHYDELLYRKEKPWYRSYAICKVMGNE